MSGERRLLVGQIGWLVAAAIVVGIYVYSVPRDWNLVRVPCAAGQPCYRARLTPADIQTLAVHGVELEMYAITLFVLRLLTALLYLVIAGLIFWRKRHDALALFGAYMLLTGGLTTTSFIFAAYSPTDPWGKLTWAMGLVSETILTFFLALFPTKTFVPLAMRWIAPALAVVNLSLYILVPSEPNVLFDLCVRSFNAVWLCTLGGAQIYRYRRVSNAVQRQQTRWVVFGVALGLGFSAVLMVVSFVVEHFHLDPSRVVMIGLRSAGYVLGLLVPLAFGIAILRDGLYNVDVWLRRTVVYSLLTGCVVTIYVVLVGAAGALFRTSDNLLVALLATGLIAVVFQPLRQQLQRRVNRLLYGERDEPYAVLTRLGQRLAATVAPDATLPMVAATIHEALRLAYVAIAVQEQDELVRVAAVGTPAEELVHVPLVYQHVPVGELILSPRNGDHPFSPADRRLLADLAHHISVAAQAVRLTQDLQRSRTHLVTAREEERRRLQRDLHDGLGPTLASLTMQLDAARALMADDPATSGALLDEVQEELKATVGNVRQLVHSLRPPVLDQFGLLRAVREHALRAGQTAGLRVDVDVPATLPALPAAVEVAAYYIVTEALTNAIRHARARHCAVRLAMLDHEAHASLSANISADEQSGTAQHPVPRSSDRALIVEVVDDGIGLPEQHPAGVGLHSMRERAAELGGTWTLTSAPGGTTVRAVLPF